MLEYTCSTLLHPRGSKVGLVCLASGTDHLCAHGPRPGVGRKLDGCWGWRMVVFAFGIFMAWWRSVPEQRIARGGGEGGRVRRREAVGHVNRMLDS